MRAAIAESSPGRHEAGILRDDDCGYLDWLAHHQGSDSSVLQWSATEGEVLIAGSGIHRLWLSVLGGR
jgi:hypothetical protein